MSRRICFEVDDELFNALNKLPWGTKSAALRHMASLVTRGIARHGDIFLGALMSNNIDLKPMEQEDDETRQASS